MKQLIYVFLTTCYGFWIKTFDDTIFFTNINIIYLYATSNEKVIVYTSVAATLSLCIIWFLGPHCNEAIETDNKTKNQIILSGTTWYYCYVPLYFLHLAQARMAKITKNNKGIEILKEIMTIDLLDITQILFLTI